MINWIERDREGLIKEWNELFDSCPALDGLTSYGVCKNVFCCPENYDSFEQLNRAAGIMFLLGIDPYMQTLRRDVVDA